MGLKQCDKCGEMVDEAKAFCPGCGDPFVVEEKRAEQSNYDRMDSTMQLGQTMYNQMLSDMGLNIGKPPSAPEKRIEVIAPVAPAAPAAPATAASVKPAPSAAPPATAAPAAEMRPAAAPAPPKPVPAAAPKASSGYMKWLILGGIVIVLGFLVVIAAGVLLYIFWPR